ncbi:hypothetical protein BgiBS90_005192 [Biomphalaria glabrata]|nr:hypothetical protein BgiBS90_005192 [Biomphalaria glabrata]
MDSKVSKLNFIPESLFGDTLPVSLVLWTKVSKLNFIPEYLFGDTLPVSLWRWLRVKLQGVHDASLQGVSMDIWISILKCLGRIGTQSVSVGLDSRVFLRS